MQFCMEVIHVMPRKFLEENDALDIAEVQAYYRIKAEDKAREDALREQIRAMEEAGKGNKGNRRRW